MPTKWPKNWASWEFYKNMPTMTHSFSSVRGSSRLTREEGGSVREQKKEHVSVMTKEVLEYLAPKDGDVVVDATFGAGGHSRALAAVADIVLISIDADPSAASGHTAHTVVEGNFGNLDAILKKSLPAGRRVDKVLFDLGWNSSQLQSGRGFSFLHDEPLLMSYGKKPASGFSAKEIINEWGEATLADVFFGYGEERYARRIARAIVARRARQAIHTSAELVEIIKSSVPAAYRNGRIHPATRTFQALRIAVNDELGVLERGLAAAWQHLSCGGRIAVISFHSIEDRVVKKRFAVYAKQGGRLVFKKPLLPSREEIQHNPRARSAKLRVIEKVC